MTGGAWQRVIAGAVFGAGLFACERAQDRAAADVVERILADHGRDAEVAIDRREGSITVRLGGPTVPEGWPADVPVHPDAEHVRVRTAGDVRTVLSITSSRAPRIVADWYRRELATEGWTLEPTNERTALVAHRGSRRLVAAFDTGGRGRIEVVSSEVDG